MRVSPLAFTAVLTVELALLWLSRTSRPRLACAARIAIFLVPLLLALGLETFQALRAADVIEWDETYYLSQAVTAADGRGLYPYVFGYRPMPILGGQGYAAYVQALAVTVAGPSIVALRIVSLAASIVALICVWLLVRRLYGSGAAWAAAALTATLRVFAHSNSARMDSFTFAWVAAALLVVAIAFDRWERKRWHVLAGAAFGLGLQFHLDTIVTAVACGLLYLVAWLREARATKRMAAPIPLLLYVAGWTIGFAAFVGFNILPDPDAFYRTTVLIRVDATSWYSEGTSSALGSFLDPRILLAKEVQRYGLLLRALHPVEILLAATAVLALVTRRSRVDLGVLTVIAGVVLAAAIVLNNASPLYFIHVAPALIMPMGPLFSHGLSRSGPVAVGAFTTGRLLIFTVVVSALFAVNSTRPLKQPPPLMHAADAAFVQTARTLVDPGCRIAGDGRLYVRYFADHPYFISTRPTEVQYAMLFHGLTEEREYWELKAPGAIVSPDTPSAGLMAYAATHGFVKRADGVWMAPGGCTPGP